MRDGSGKWLPSQWQKLMDLTLQSIDSVTGEGESAPFWTFGGGTALAIELEHRVSYDIDAFLDSATIIQRLVPVGNPVTRRICWNPETDRADYQYPGHYLKLNILGAGEIDFLAASSLLENSTIPFAFAGRTIVRERPCEIIAKKIYYRGSTFKPRDVFDLAGTYLALPGELAKAAKSPFLTPEIYARVRLRIESRSHAFQTEMQDNINPTDFGRSYSANASKLALEALAFMQDLPK
jgi:Nucleotidyl transferase AbiEii toxin, Type IV TA system